MSINEYALYSQGYFIRNARSQEPFRKLYHILWNANTDKAHKIRSVDSFARHWPLFTDKDQGIGITKDDMATRWENMKKKLFSRKKTG